MNKVERASKLLVEGLRKAKKMPIGSISKGRKKIAEGKWVKVENKEGNEDKEIQKNKNKRTINKEEVKKEIDFIEKELKKYPKMNYKAQRFLENRGYVFRIIGKGLNNSTSSKSISEMEFNDKPYVKGDYLLIETKNTDYEDGIIFNGFLKKILDKETRRIIKDREIQKNKNKRTIKKEIDFI